MLAHHLKANLPDFHITFEPLPSSDAWTEHAAKIFQANKYNNKSPTLRSNLVLDGTKGLLMTED